ncbi:MAG: hypothetical protein AB7O99_05650, partial [Dongiaceae bacterium]
MSAVLEKPRTSQISTASPWGEAEGSERPRAASAEQKKFEELLKDPRLQQMMALLEETLGSQALVGLDVKDILALLE